MKRQLYSINIASFKDNHYFINEIPTVANVKFNSAQDSYRGSNFIVLKKKMFGEYI